MTRAVRGAILVATSFLALAFVGTALAAYTPRLIVLHERAQLGGGGETAVLFTQPRTDEATAKITIYAAAGYTVNFAAPGTQIGTAEATVQARAISPDIFLPVRGTIVAGNPADPALAGPATQCTGTATHQAVWVLVLTASGRELRVPVYVDQATGGEATFASVKLQVCLPPPDVPESAGGAAFGAKLVDAALVFNRGVFTTPRAASIYQWTAYFTPYTNNRPPVNVAGTIQSRALVALPVTITVRAKYNKKRKRVTLSGTFRMAGAAGTGSRLAIYQGTRANRLRRVGVTPAVRRNGSFSAVRRVRRGTHYFQLVIQVAAPVDQEGCAITSRAPAAPGGCVTATLGVYGVSRIVRVRAT